MLIEEPAAPQTGAVSALHGSISEAGVSKETSPDSETTFRLVFETIPCAIGIADQEGNVLEANPCMEQITGYCLEELQMVGLEALYSDPMLRQQLLASLSTFGSVRDWEARLRRKDGTIFDAVLNVKQVELGGQKRLLTNMREITQRKKIEELNKSELKYRTLVEQSLQGLAIVQEERFVFCNNALATMTGYSVEELLSFPDSKVLVHPEDRASVYAFHLDRMAGRPVPAHYEHRIIKKDGTVRWMEVHPSFIKHNGRSAIQVVNLDITERRQAQDALRESEQRFRLIAETIDEVFWFFDAEKGATYISPAHERIWGCRPQHLYENPNSFYDFVHPDDRELVAANNARLVNEGRPFEHEYRIIRADGSIRHIWDRGFPIADESGQIKRYVGVAQDVTERRRDQENLRTSEEYLNQIINCIGDPIFVKDRQHKFVLTNDANCSMVGMPREEIIGRTLYDALPKEIMGPLIEQEEQIFETGKPSISVEELQDIKGQRYISMANKTLLTDANGQKQIVGVIRDITELKRAEKALRESEESYRTAIEHCNDGVAIARGTINLFVNQRFADMFGYDKPEEIVGKPLSLIVHPDDLKRVGEVTLRRQQGETVPPRYEIKGIRKDGDLIDIEITATQTVYRGKAATLAYLRDITKHKHAEEEREKLQEQVRQSQKLEAVGLLAGGVAHDFNNLLNVINGYSELLLKDFDQDDPKHSDLEQIMQAGQRAASLTSQLLAFSRKQIIQPRILNLNDVITDMSKMLGRMIGEDIEFVCVTRPGLGFVHIDPGQIQQIIMNLVVNARDAMPQGGKLSLETANVDFEEDCVRSHAMMPLGSYIMLAISDNGIGMEAETQAHIFEPFFTTKGRGKGTGLGLSTVYGIVKQSEGFVWVYSELGKGTTFKIYLPRMQGESARPSDGAKEEPDLRGTETVLLVEDEPSVRALAGRILRERGYTVIEGSNGKEALHAAQEFAGEIHLVLTDVVMPEMSGKVLVSQIKASLPEIKTLYISGYTDNAIVHHGILESSVSFLQKPFSADGLARKVREVIDS